MIPQSLYKSKPDLRKEIKGAKIVQKQETWQKFCVISRMRKKLHRRKIRKADAAHLAQVRDDSTINSDVTVPRTLDEALPKDLSIRNADERAIVVTEATGSFNMIGCNKAWENLCGFAECEIVGKDSSVLQGPDTNFDGLRDAVSRLFEGEKKVNVVTTNYRKDGSKFRNYLTLAPLKENGKITHFVAILKDIGSGSGGMKQ